MPPPPNRSVRWLLIAVGVLVLIIAVLVTLLALQSAAGPGAAASAKPTPSTTAPSTATGGATAAPTKAPGATTAPPKLTATIPTDCTKLYTVDWAAETHLVLNPAWAAENAYWPVGDTQALEILKASTKLTCSWLTPGGPSEVGIHTNVAKVSAGQSATVLARLKAIGQTCTEQLGGIRCLESHSTEEGAWGESHLLRGDIWLATSWANAGPEGYTADMAKALFG